jgi:hypothetical protein
VETDLVRNTLSMSTESTNNFHGYSQATKTFSMVTARLYKEPCREERFIRKTVVVQGSRSRRDDTHSPVRNGASLEQSLMGSCYN